MATFGIVEGIALAAAVASATATAYSVYRKRPGAEPATAYQSDVAEQQAEVARGAAGVQAEEARARSKQLQATARSRISASGVITEGSPLMVLMSNAEQSELEAQRIKWSGATQVTGYESQSPYSQYQARQARQAGSWGAGTSLLGGVANTSALVYGFQRDRFLQGGPDGAGG
jgi:hypothetical protein